METFDDIVFLVPGFVPSETTAPSPDQWEFLNGDDRTWLDGSDAEFQ